MKRIFILVAVLIFAAVAFTDASQALRITLKRVVFEGSKRAEVVTIINNKDEPTTYRLGWRHFRMTQDSGLVVVPDDALTPDIKPVVDMVRFAPRRFTVPPNSSQQVRMMLRMPADLADGEYRSHFWVRPEADVESLRAKAEAHNKKTGVKSGVSLEMLAGVTMPIIVRKGAFEVDLSIVDAKARASGGFVTVSYSLVRDGNRSVYGDIDYVCNPGAGDEFFLKSTRGIAVYVEAAQRDFDLRIEKLEDQPSCKTLSITFSETEGFDGGKMDVMAQDIVQVN
jgi:hypothetical protein